MEERNSLQRLAFAGIRARAVLVEREEEEEARTWKLLSRRARRREPLDQETSTRVLGKPSNRLTRRTPLSLSPLLPFHPWARTWCSGSCASRPRQQQRHDDAHSVEQQPHQHTHFKLIQLGSDSERASEEEIVIVGTQDTGNHIMLRPSFDKAWSALTDPLASTRLRQGSSVDGSRARLAQHRCSVQYRA